KSATNARELARYLEGQNTERQSKERKATQQAKELLAGSDLARVSGIVLASEEWHAGVVGIVAGRLAGQFARPASVVSLREDGAGRWRPGRAGRSRGSRCTRRSRRARPTSAVTADTPPRPG